MSTSPADPERPDGEDTPGSQDTAGETPAADPAGNGRAEPEDVPTDGTPADETSATPKLPDSLTFRITPVALLAVLAVAVCASPAAAALPWLSVLYLAPLGLLIWVLRVRTTVHGGGLTVRTVLRRRELAWEEIRSLHLDERRWVRAVVRDGEEVRLPAVRVRDLPRLAAMSGGRLSNPDELPADMPAADDAPPDEPR